MPSSPARSLTERLYLSMRADIVAGHLAPGSRLRPTKLAAEAGVSLNVVREALNRLAGERLVAASPQQGFAVVEISIRDLEELTALRSVLETIAIRDSIQARTLGWESELIASHHRLAGTPMAEAGRPGTLSADWMAAHNDFHAATMSNCGNGRLIAITMSLGESAAIYRHWSRLLDHEERDIAGEHRAIFEAAIAGDAEEAARCHVEHIRRTAAIVIAALSAPAPTQQATARGIA